MKKLANKVITYAMVAMMAISATGGAKSLMAANITDRNWSFSLSVNNQNMQFIAREIKEDYSYIYVYWKQSMGGNLDKITVSPYGGSSSGELKAAGTKYGGERRTILNTIGEYRLINFVKENGHSYASIGMIGNKGAGFASGVWSPDSIGSAPIQ